MQRNTINRPFVFSAKFLAKKERKLFREVMLIIIVVCATGLVLDGVARYVGL